MSGARRVVEVPTAGVIPWRRHHGRLEVAMVHRGRYDDWSWPKGKLDGLETWAGAAVRESYEEMGLRMRLGVPLPDARYPLGSRTGQREEKVVRYWAAQRVGGRGLLRHEVDKVRWVPVEKAPTLLTYRRDLDQLRALREHARKGALDTWPLVLVRHGVAVPRKQWHRKDWIRPLEPRGRDQARDLVDLLKAYDIRSVTSSSSTRCVHTIAPYAAAAHRKIASTMWLSEEGFEDKPARSRRILERTLEDGRPALLCSHGPVLPSLLQALARRMSKGAALSLLRDAEDEKMVKGEALVAHIRGRGSRAQIVAVERHLPIH